MKFLLDTNFLVYIFDSKLNPYEMISAVVSSSFSIHCLSLTIDELKKIGRNDVVEWIEKVDIKVIKYDCNDKVDNCILKFAKDNSMCILTQDIELINLAVKQGVCVGRKFHRWIKIINTA